MGISVLEIPSMWVSLLTRDILENKSVFRLQTYIQACHIGVPPRTPGGGATRLQLCPDVCVQK